MSLALLGKIGAIKSFKPHDFICIENDVGNEMYIILKGKVGVYLNSFDESFEVDQLGPGCFFGEMSLLEHMVRSATIIALSEGATVIEIKKENFPELLDHIDISFRIMKSLLDRANKMLNQLSDQDAEKTKKYKADGYYPTLMNISEQDFYNIVTYDKQKALEMLKYLSRMIRKTNEEIINITNDKHVPLTLNTAANLDFIPKEHQHYSFLIKEDFGDTLLERTLKCPICDKEFKQLQPRITKIKLRTIQNDLRKIYENFDPLWFNITTCPDCLYSNYSNEFVILAPKYIKQIKDKLKEAASLKTAMQLDPLDINRIFLQYYLTILCSVEKPLNELKQGRLWLNLSWLYKDVEDENMYVYAYTKASEHYLANYLHSSNELSENDEQSLLIILGELHARQGQYEEAIKILFEVSRIKNSNKQLVDMASQAIYDIKTHIKTTSS